ncbi:uncharacterized protein LOC121384166 [Gigantopelta aegis]|uniref:uncharacterized protein LOC121384166 n=1 Tax=Gigantopelta aegis TaxID=1735272 RepID=UPI001B88C618|nr:uncharacterized protein LOC121384166 [Gigantopelta aegis]
MILLLGDGEMTQGTPDGHHNLSKVRLLQNKLLEADDKSAIESWKSVYRNNSRVTSAKNGRDPLCYEITGWIPKNINFRKTGKEGEKGKEGSKDKDSRSKANHGDRYDNFVFSHYRDPKKYILQYREQHSFFDPLSAAAKKRLHGNNYIPPQQQQLLQNDNPSPNQRTQHNFHYTRRESQKLTKIKRDDSSPSDSNTTDGNTGTELDSYRDKLKVVGSRSSRTENSESSPVSLSRVTVPAPLTLPQTNVGVKQTTSVSNGTQTPNIKPECQQIGPRTLDTLTCIADDKQCLLTPRSIDSLTWREQLDALRQIRPRMKSKKRSARLFFFKEDGAFHVQGSNDCFSIEKCPEDFDPMNKEQVSQQRRIRHLVEQSKLKCAANFVDASSSSDAAKGKSGNVSAGQIESVKTHSTSDKNSGSSANTSSAPDVKADGGSSEGGVSEDSGAQVTKYCPSLIWRLPKYQFSYTTISHLQRSHTCVPSDRRF